MMGTSASSRCAWSAASGATAGSTTVVKPMLAYRHPVSNVEEGAFDSGAAAGFGAEAR